MSGPSLVMASGGRFTRRLNSNEATRESLSLGPTVVVPPRHLMAPSGANEVATAMATARQKVETVSAPGTPRSPIESHVTDKYAYAFDIDGVLIRGGKPIPEAIEAMKMLNGENEYGIKVYDELSPPR
jgi:hypothetical protein